MKKKSQLVSLGNHRGGYALVAGMTSAVASSYDNRWLFSDPHEDRSQQLADYARNRFPEKNPVAYHQRAQDLLPDLDSKQRLLLALDTVKDIRATLISPQLLQTTSWQLVGRAPGGIGAQRFGLQGTMIRHDDEHRRQTQLLLDALDGLSHEASSQVLAEDPVTAMSLGIMRRQTAGQTLSHLAYADPEPIDLPFGPLNILLGKHSYPLVPVTVESGDRPKWSQIKEQALQKMNMVPSQHLTDLGFQQRSAQIAVILPTPEIIIIQVTENAVGRRRVDGRFSIEPLPAERPVTQRAVFTD